MSRKFDTQWLVPLRFLDLAQEQINRDISTAHLGELVLIQGALGILDLKLLRSAWDVQSIKQKATEGASGEAVGTHKERQQAKREAESNVNFVIDVLKIMPHITQVALACDGARVWGTINEDYLITSTSDLMLKHGMNISGTWAMLGILDAEPDSSLSDFSIEEQGQIEAATAVSAFGGSPISALAMTIAPLAKLILGRPSDSFGVTPLLIFRELNA